MALEEYFDIRCGVLEGYSGPGGAVTLPEGVKAVGRFAFHECGTLSVVTLPEGLTEIGAFAFCGCGGLREVRLPRSLLTIGEFAFAECHSLVKLSFPKGLREIGADAALVGEVLMRAKDRIAMIRALREAAR